MTLDTTKPMMTRDGRKVVEFHVFRDGTIAYQLEHQAGDGIFCFPDGFYHSTRNPHDFDLLNCPPEPVVLWVMLMPLGTEWFAYSSANSEGNAAAWQAKDPANRRVVRVEVPE